MPERVTSPTADFPHRRAPAKNWAALWALSFLSALLILGGADAFWRSRGHRPSVVDGPELWAYHRSRVSAGESRAVVVLGSSRVQLGLSTDTFRARLPHRPIAQLAIDGSTPVAALRDLAEDEAFRGLIICEITEPAFLRAAWDDQQAYVNYGRDRYWPWHAFEVQAALRLQERCVVVNPQLRMLNVLHSLRVDHDWPRPLYVITRSDRSRLADYTMTDQDERATQERRRELVRTPGPAVDPTAWWNDVAEVERWVKQIEARGGRVVFVRMPVADDLWRHDERSYPRQQFWNALAARTQAHTIHFRDIPAMRQLPTPDGSHLDHRDAPAFTHALIDELVRAGVLEAGS